MASQALVLTVTLVLLLAASCAFCGKVSSEDKDACFKEAMATSPVSDEDKQKAIEIKKQVHKEAVQMFREKGKEATMKELRGKNLAAEKVDAADDIKDKEATKNFLKALDQCLKDKFAIRKYEKCEKAKEVNNDRLKAEDLTKMMRAIFKAHEESEGPISDGDMEKKFTEALGSEEKAKVAMEVHKALGECMKKFKSKMEAKEE